MTWYGMVCVVWCGMMRYAAVWWVGVGVWFDVAWYGLVWHGVVGYVAFVCCMLEERVVRRNVHPWG